jgi:hypothetical protein
LDLVITITFPDSDIDATTQSCTVFTPTDGANSCTWISTTITYTGTLISPLAWDVGTDMSFKFSIASLALPERSTVFYNIEIDYDADHLVGTTQSVSLTNSKRPTFSTTDFFMYYDSVADNTEFSINIEASRDTDITLDRELVITITFYDTEFDPTAKTCNVVTPVSIVGTITNSCTWSADGSSRKLIYTANKIGSSSWLVSTFMTFSF